MVFTIVTIIFLPMSFIAAFFAINFKDWGDRLTIGYVSKYMFGIGLAISFVFVASAFLVHDISDAWKTVVKGVKKYTSTLFQTTKVCHEKDRPPDDVPAWPTPDEHYKPDTAGGVSTAYRSIAEDVDWKRRALEGPETYMRMSWDREKLEHARLGLSPRFGARKMSIGSGGIPRLSLDGGRRGRFSGDLERGRDPSRSRVRWEPACGNV